MINDDKYNHNTSTIGNTIDHNNAITSNSNHKHTNRNNDTLNDNNAKQ